MNKRGDVSWQELLIAILFLVGIIAIITVVSKILAG
jgi:hypothetical protein